MQNHKIGVHVTDSHRDNYGPVAPHLVAVTTFHAGAFDEVPADTIKIFRTHSVHDHKDAPGDFDRLPDDMLAAAAEYWWGKLEPIYRPIKDQYENVYFQPINEINNPRTVIYLRGIVKAAERDGYKLALWGDAGASPDLDDWQALWLPFMKEVQAGGHIYSRHAYSGVTSENAYLTGADGSPTDDNTGRPFVEARLMREAGVQMPMVITELGWLGGWNNLPPHWLDDLLRYNELMMAHENIAGACLWNAGQWETAPNILSGQPLLELGSRLESMTSQFWDGSSIVIDPKPVEIDPDPAVANDEHLFLERFQKLSWYDWKLPSGVRSNMQVPIGMDVENDHGDNGFGDGKPWNDFGYAEAAFLTTGHNLPENDRERYTLWPSRAYPAENVVYKLFADRAFRSVFSVSIDAKKGQSYRASTQFYADFALYDSVFGKQTDGVDRRHGLVRVWLGSQPTDYTELTYQERQTVAHEFRAVDDGPITAHFEFVSSYAMAAGVGVAGFFITEFAVAELDGGTVQPIEPADDSNLKDDFSYDATSILLPQDAPFLVLAQSPAWADLVQEVDYFRRDIFWSHHGAISSLMAPKSAGSRAKLVVYGDRPEAVALATRYGIESEVRLRPDSDPAVPVPDEPVNPFAGFSLGQPLSVRWAITDRFNAVRSYGNHKHEGIDLDDATRTGNSRADVLATNNGRIAAVKRHSGGYGLHVVLQGNHNGFPFTITYGHLEQVFVETGQYVEAGHALGEIGTSGNSTGEHLHITLQLHGWGLDGYVRDDVVDPEPFLPNPALAGQIRPPATGRTFDMLDYMFGPNGTQYMFETADGPQERYRIEVSDRTGYFVKNHQYEKYSWDDRWIYQDTDTSPGNDQFYTVRRSITSEALVARMPRRMHVGQAWFGLPHHVQFYYKKDCQPVPLSVNPSSGAAKNRAELIKVGDWQSPHTGRTFPNCAVLKLGAEVQIWQRGTGPVGWIAPWGSAEMVGEMIANQAPMKRESGGCY